jgi:hypothetical protein
MIQTILSNFLEMSDSPLPPPSIFPQMIEKQEKNANVKIKIQSESIILYNVLYLIYKYFKYIILILSGE